MLDNLNQNENVSTNEYRSRDLGESSVIYLKGVSLNRIEKINSICWFVFSDLEKCQELSVAYWSGHCPVDARSFNHANAILKSKMFTD
jgi:hypothetical protein